QIFVAALDNTTAVPVGTGFLVGPDLVLTSYHVLAGVLQGIVSRTQVSFRFDRVQHSADVTHEGLSIKLLDSEAWLVDHSPSEFGVSQAPGPVELDFALVRLASPVGNEPDRGWIWLPSHPPPAGAPTDLCILQHPRGKPLRAASGELSAGSMLC